MPTPSLASELRVAVGRASRRIRAERGQAGLPDNQFSVLLWIEKRGPLTPGQLAELERIQPPSMTRTVSCLADDGLVSKAAHPTDGRAVVVTLTDEGRAEIAETRRRRDTWLAARLETLTADERAHLAAATDILRRLADS